MHISIDEADGLHEGVIFGFPVGLWDRNIRGLAWWRRFLFCCLLFLYSVSPRTRDGSLPQSFMMVVLLLLSAVCVVVGVLYCLLIVACNNNIVGEIGVAH